MVWVSCVKISLADLINHRKVLHLASGVQTTNHFACLKKTTPIEKTKPCSANQMHGIRRLWGRGLAAQPQRGGSETLLTRREKGQIQRSVCTFPSKRCTNNLKKMITKFRFEMLFFFSVSRSGHSGNKATRISDTNTQMIHLRLYLAHD